MKIGICTSPETLAAAKRIGFDYAELNLSAVAALSEEDFTALFAAVQENGLPVEAMNVLFPGGITLVGSQANLADVKAYLAKAFPRAQALGAEVIVFGSGRARMIPDGVSDEEAQAALVAAAKLVGMEAAKFGLTVVMEPLNRGETNSVNSLAEGKAIADAADLPNVQLLADFYHMSKEQEPMDEVGKAGALAHTHIARGEGRTYPLSRSEDDYEGFFRALSAIGYTGRMSIEGGTQDFEADAPAALAFLRGLAKECSL